VVGVGVGIGGAILFGSLSDMRMVVDPTPILLVFGSAAAVGVFFSFCPANKAA